MPSDYLVRELDRLYPERAVKRRLHEIEHMGSDAKPQEHSPYFGIVILTASCGLWVALALAGMAVFP